MKVDFNQDEFGEIWLMHVEKLYVRKERKVPTDDGNKLADFVLSQMESQAKVDEARKKEQMRGLVKTANMAVDSALLQNIMALKGDKEEES